jgi:beta-glucosidase
VVEPYQDRSNKVENRVEDLLTRLMLEDKAGLMFHDIVAMMPGGQLMGADNPFGRPATEAAIREMRLNHFNLAGGVDNVGDLVAWHNRVQELALATGAGIPVTVSTDPRHSFSNNPGTESLAGAFSQWPQSLGFAGPRRRQPRAALRRHRPPGVPRCRHPGGSTPADRPGHRTPLGPDRDDVR